MVGEGIEIDIMRKAGICYIGQRKQRRYGVGFVVSYSVIGFFFTTPASNESTYQLMNTIRNYTTTKVTQNNMR